MDLESITTDKNHSLFYDLKEFIKLRLALLVVFTAGITYLTALKFNHKEIDWLSAFWLCFGGMLVTIGSNGFNQIFEKSIYKFFTILLTAIVSILYCLIILFIIKTENNKFIKPKIKIEN